MAQLVAPVGWPSGVRPPGAPEWLESATRWLLDLAPPEYRAYPLLRRHPVVLAGFVARHVEGCLGSARRGVAEARISLRDHVSPEVVEEAVEVWERELARLAMVDKEVSLVQDALRGRRFRARL